MNEPIEELVGIGRTSAKWLREVGIDSREDLEEVGVVEAFRRVRAGNHHGTLNLLWALQGGLMEVHWTKVPLALREQLRDELESKA